MAGTCLGTHRSPRALAPTGAPMPGHPPEPPCLRRATCPWDPRHQVGSKGAGGTRCIPVLAPRGSGQPGARGERQGVFPSMFSPALSLILHLTQMVSTSMLRCACRCYDNECILKTNTSTWHIADQPTPNVSQPTRGCCGYGCSAYGPGWRRCSADPTGARERLMLR